MNQYLKNFAVGYAVLSVLAAKYFLTNQQFFNQLRYMTRYRPVWSSGFCIGAYCKKVTADCFMDDKCRQTVGCVQLCTLDLIDEPERIAECAYICEMTSGYENQQFWDMMKCMVENSCLDRYPDDGPCIGTDEDAIKSLKSMEDIKGDWWVIAGVNCGQSREYPGGYDWYPCQHERFTKEPSGQWINTVTFCNGKNDVCTSEIITTIANVSMPKNGVVHVEYLDAPLEPQIENWRIVSMPTPDYALVMWCGQLPVLDYNGVIAISRHRNGNKMPKKVEDDFRRVMSKHGLNWDEVCRSNNDHCD